MNVTRMQHEQHGCDTSETRVTRVQNECNTSATGTTQVRHKCYTSGKKFDVDSNKSENVFSHSFITYIENKRLQCEEQFHSKNYLLKMPFSHTKLHFKKSYNKL